jgi:hypothetical protein
VDYSGLTDAEQDELILRDQTWEALDQLDAALSVMGSVLSDFFPPVLVDQNGNLIGWPPNQGQLY